MFLGVSFCLCFVCFVSCVSLSVVFSASCVVFLRVPCFLMFRVSWCVVFLGVLCLLVLRVPWRVVPIGVS